MEAAFVVIKAQSTEAYEELQSALSEQIQHFGKAMGTLSTLPDNRERAQACLARLVHTQSQELEDDRIKAEEEGDQMSELYPKSWQEAKKDTGGRTENGRKPRARKEISRVKDAKGLCGEIKGIQ